MNNTSSIHGHSVLTYAHKAIHGDVILTSEDGVGSEETENLFKVVKKVTAHHQHQEL